MRPQSLIGFAAPAVELLPPIILLTSGPNVCQQSARRDIVSIGGDQPFGDLRRGVELPSPQRILGSRQLLVTQPSRFDSCRQILQFSAARKALPAVGDSL